MKFLVLLVVSVFLGGTMPSNGDKKVPSPPMHPLPANSFSAACTPERTEEGILWSTRETGIANFIGASLLSSCPLDRLPVAESCRKTFLYHVERIRSPLNLIVRHPSIGPCGKAYSPPGAGTAPDAKDLAGVVAKAPLVVRGEVVGIEPGWDCVKREVVSRLEFRVDQVLKDLNGATAKNRYFWALEMGGSLQYQGSTLCTSPHDGFAVFEVGQKVLASGWVDDTNGRWIVGGLYPVVGTLVFPQPYAGLRQVEPVALDVLEGGIR